MSKTVEYMNINLERRDNKDFSHFDNKLQRGFTKSASWVKYSAQEATLNLYSPDSLATISQNLGLRPMALRHTLSDALPFSDFLMSVFYLIPSSYSFRCE